jgi:nucleoside-diphosphate kinase
MVIEGKDAVGIIKRLVGPTKPEVAKSEAPGSIRGQWVIDNFEERKAKGEVVDNICHASATPEEAEWEIEVVFPELDIDPEDWNSR